MVMLLVLQDFIEFEPEIKFASINTENLGIADTVSTTKSFQRSLSESLALSDILVASKSTPPLSESLSLSDVSTKQVTKSLTESLSLSDTLTKIQSTTTYVQESLSLSDTLVASRLISLSESLSLSDTISTTKLNPTTFYLHDITTSYAPTNDEKSTALPVGTFTGNSGTGFEDLSMSSTKGTSQTSKTITSLAQNTHQDEYLARFTSPTLGAQTIPARTWTLSVATKESATNANSFAVGSIYVWRPSTSSVVGYIYDSASPRNPEFTTGERGEIYSLSGSSVATQVGDVIVLEFWVDATQTGTASTKVNTLYFDGTGTITNGTGTSNAASSLYVPFALTYGVSLNESLSLTSTVLKSASLTESLALGDVISSTKTKSLPESLSLVDSLNKIVTKSLSEDLSLADSTTTNSSKVSSLTESLPITDTISTPKTKLQSLTESLSLVDTIATPKTTLQSLTESLPITDSTTTNSFKTSSLTESLTLVDTISAPKTKLQSLSESLPITDSTTIAASKTSSLSESLSLADKVSTLTTKSSSLTESLSLADSTITTKSKAYSLTESLPITDSTITTTSKTYSLTESLPITDAISAPKTKSQSLTESLPITDSIVTTKSKLSSLSESLSLVDTVSTPKTTLQSLTELLSLDDSTITTKSKTTSLTESLPLTDTVSTPKTKLQSLSESLSLDDSPLVLAKTKSVSLSESLALSDTTSRIQSTSASLSESLILSDTTTQNQSTSVSLSESLALTDTTTRNPTKSLAEQISIADPSLFSLKSKIVSLSDSLSVSDVSTKHLNKLLSDSIAIADTFALHTNMISLTDGLALSDMVSKQDLKIISDDISLSISSTGTANLQNNQNLVEAGQKSITIDPVKPELLVVSNDISLSNVVIPSTVTNPVINYTAIQQTSGSTTSVLVTNPLTITKNTDGTIPTVKITIPGNTTITGNTFWNGAFTLPTIQSSSTISLPTTPNQVNTPQTIIKIGSDVPISFNKPVRLLFAGQAGLRVGFFHSSPTVTEITATCTSDSLSGIPSGSNECKINVGHDLVVLTNHFTGFATWSSSSVSSGTSTGTGAGTGSGGGGGGIGVGPSVGTSSSSSSSNAGGVGPYLEIQKVSYDICDKQIVQILVGTDSNDTNPMVIVRTSLTGTVDAKLASDQPYAQENVNGTIRKLVYEAYISPKEKSFEVVALQSVGHNVFSVGKTIQITGCNESVDFTQIQSLSQLSVMDASEPRIFDVKLQVGNGVKIQSSEDNSSVDSQPISVFAIIDSKTSIDSAELRFTNLNNTLANYNTINMQVVPIQITNSTYMISGTIQNNLLQAPAVTYWIHVHNAVGKSSDSDHYTLAVRPNYPISGKLEVDINPAVIEGSMDHVSAYFNNGGKGPIYGSIVLTVDGNDVYTSPKQIFGVGDTQVNLEWKVPTTNKMVPHTIQSRAEIYGQSIQTNSYMITAFPGILSVSLSKLNNVELMSLGNNTTANPSVLYSSFVNDGSMHYTVTAPDGTCVIGENDNCIITTSSRDNLKSITIDNQIYRVRYSGPGSSLERFSITSVDPIIGNWKVEIESKQSVVPQVQIMNDVFLKIKYENTDTTPITLHSK